MSLHPVPEVERSFHVTRTEALRPADPPLGVEVAADNNVMKVTPDCLFMRTAEGTIYGGRRSMSWWAVIVTVFVWGGFLAFQPFDYRADMAAGKFDGSFLQYFFAYWYIPSGIASGLLLMCFWMFIPWRRQLPIIFNRATRKVTCEIDKRIISWDWDLLEAYIKDVTTVAVGGAPMNEGVLTLAFNVCNPDKGNRMERLHIGIKGTEDAIAALPHRGIYGAAMVWEYIRLYMREGADALPPICPLAKYRLDHVSESFKQFNPLSALKVKVYWLPLAIPFFIFVALPFSVLLVLGDLLYMALDRVLPRRKWPREMLEACGGVWDGREG